jgi:hypothetical protein
MARLARLGAYHYAGESVNPKTGRTIRHDKVWIAAVIDFEDGRGQYLSFWGARTPNNRNTLPRSLAAPAALADAITQHDRFVARKANEGYLEVVPLNDSQYGVSTTIRALADEVTRISGSRPAAPQPAREPSPPPRVNVGERPDPMPYSASLAAQGCEGLRSHQHCRTYTLAPSSPSPAISGGVGVFRRHVQPRKASGGYLDGPSFACDGCHPKPAATAPAPEPQPIIPEPDPDAPVLRRARRIDF